MKPIKESALEPYVDIDREHRKTFQAKLPALPDFSDYAEKQRKDESIEQFALDESSETDSIPYALPPSKQVDRHDPIHLDDSLEDDDAKEVELPPDETPGDFSTDEDDNGTVDARVKNAGRVVTHRLEAVGAKMLR